MPQDMNDAPLAVGDEVTIRFKVIGVHPFQQDYDLSLQAVKPETMGEEPDVTIPVLAVSSKIVTKRTGEIIP